ncbi:MAG: 2,3-bisphosphoglycerate-independent phosphoglycerate mutase [Rhodospirillaceae bacterium]|nr:2,3-bisphosphoglycerate-independent phosphoglycerate mutase [Rhodospirillaceae bacterium]
MAAHAQNTPDRDPARRGAVRPVVLCILDGWGHRDNGADNAIDKAKAPVWKRLTRTCPHALLQASESFVGLPSGQMGNSEVGHMNIGAGRVVMQDLPRIDEAFATGAVASNPRFRDLVARLKASSGRCHLMGLMSPGGVHSHQKHIEGLALLLAKAGVPVVVHAFLDGRDTPPQSARGYMEGFLGAVAGLPGIALGVVSGRYYVMDRDRRWDRVALAYDALVDAHGLAAPDALAAIDAAYGRGETDEFVKPTVVAGYAGMRDGDGVLCANFRADRVREILSALLDPAFEGFVRKRTVRFAAAAGLTEYSKELDRLLLTLFEPQELKEVLGEVVSAAGLKQLRIAETEKYAHVTFFLNGGEERQYPGEERILVPSPKVATYDLKPEMSAFEVTDRLVEAIDSGRFDLVVVNYANGDMVGHSGVLEAAIRAVEAVDACLGRLEEAVRRAGGALIITADHGNAEMMVDPVTGAPHTAHTLNPVPVLVVNAPAWVMGLRNGRLSDIAPTVLALLGLPQPEAMTGRSLIVAERAVQAAGARASA